MSSQRGLARILVLLALAASACKTPASAPAASPNTWAIVDGRAITSDDVDKAYRRQHDSSQTPPAEELAAAKLTLLDDLIVQDILLARAAALKLEVPAADIDKAEADARKNLPDGTFEQELTKRNLTAADMREGLRRQLLAQKVITQEVESKVDVPDQVVTDFFEANRAQFNVPEEGYRIAQIIVTPVRDPQVANATGDDATTPQEANAKVQMLMERLKSGANFQELAAGYSEDPESAPRGGDMGLVTMSRLKQAPPALRNAVVGRDVGSVNVINTGNALMLVAVMGHELAGQRDLSTPGLKENIRETLRARKLQLMRTAYLTAARSDAKVQHLLARKLFESGGKLP